MPANLTDVDAFTDPVQAPADGDAANGTTFQLAPQALANRTRNLKNRLEVLEALATDLLELRETSRTYKIVNGTYAAGATLDLAAQPGGGTHGFTESPAGELLLTSGVSGGGSPHRFLVILNVFTPDGTFTVALQKGGTEIARCRGPTIGGAADVGAGVSMIVSCTTPASEKLRLVNALGGDLIIDDGSSDVASTLTIQRMA